MVGFGCSVRSVRRSEARIPSRFKFQGFDTETEWKIQRRSRFPFTWYTVDRSLPFAVKVTRPVARSIRQPISRSEVERLEEDGLTASPAHTM